ncbi:Ras guanine nucleotide exchange factor F [Diplonema papillatum]|nr:Ras guanine nucleotide exchange factor F [Diplonema papillatum]
MLRATAVLLLVAAEAASGAGTSLEVVPSTQVGERVFSDWVPWRPGGPDRVGVFVGWNESCGPGTPMYVDCDAIMEKPPRVVRHTSVVMEDFDGDEVMVIFGGQAAASALQVSQRLSTAVYEYHVRLALWSMPFNASDGFVFDNNTYPVARHSHVAWVAPFPKDVSTEVKVAANCGSSCRMIIHGGFNSNGVPLSDTWQYMNGTWTRLPDANAPALAGHSAVLVGRYVYVFGGQGIDAVANASTWVFNLDNLHWTLLSAVGPAPSGRAYHAMFALPTKLASRKLDSLDVQVPDAIFVHGGAYTNAVGEKTDTRDWWRLDVGNIQFPNVTWEEIFPQAGGYRNLARGEFVAGFATPNRAGHTCFTVNYKALCFGGWSRGVYRDLVAFDAVLNRITTPDFSSVPPQRIYYATGAHAPKQAKSFIVGGVVGESLRNFPDPMLWGSAYVPHTCLPGWFSPDNDYRCFPCPNGYMSAGNDCFLCGPGTYVSSKGGNCTLCPPGYWTDASGSTDISACIACPAGYQLPEGGGTSLSSCVPCPLGTYTIDVGTGTCIKCPAGTKGAMEAATSRWEGCAPCPYGTSSGAGSDACTECPAGTQSGEMTKRMQPFALAISAWGRDDCGSGCPTTSCLGAKCATCPAFLCGSCGPDPATYYAISGEVFHLKLRVYDVGALTVNSPERMLRMDERNYMANGAVAITVEAHGSEGPLYVQCQHDFEPDAPGCVGSAELQDGETGGLATAHSGTSSLNPCRQDGDRDAWHFSLRLDAAVAETTLIFRMEAMMTASLTLRVVGNNITVSQQPPTFVVATHPFEVSVTFLDVLNRRDTLATHNLILASLVCTDVVDGVVQAAIRPVTYKVDGSAAQPATTSTSGLGPLVAGTHTFTLSVSGPTFDDGIVGAGMQDGTMLECRVTFRADFDEQPTAESNPFYVQQPYVVHVLHPTTTWSTEPVAITAQILDADGVLVSGDNRTRVDLSPIVDAHISAADGFYNSSVQALDGTSLSLVVTRGEAVFYAQLANPLFNGGAAALRVDASAAYSGIEIIHNDTVYIVSRETLATELALASPAQYPGLVDEYPAFFMSNRTLKVGIRAVDSGKNLDGHADFLVGLNVSCDDGFAEVAATNYSQDEPLVARLEDGVAFFHVQLSALDGVCSLNFYHVPSVRDAEDMSIGNRTVAFLNAPDIAIRNPGYLDVAWDVPDCEVPDCLTCAADITTDYTIKVTLKSTDGTVVTHHPPATYVELRTSAPAGSLHLDPPGRHPAVLVLLQGGFAQFTFHALTELNDTFGFTVGVGPLTDVVVENVTYSYSQRLLGMRRNAEEVDRYPIVVPMSTVGVVGTCELTTTVIATELHVETTPVQWLGSGEHIQIEVEARDAFGHRDIRIAGTAVLSVVNCEGGLHRAPEFYWVASDGTEHLFTDAATVPSFAKGHSTMTIYGVLPSSHYEHDVAYMQTRGAKGCRLKVELTPTLPVGHGTLHGSWDPFELVNLAEVCHPCPLGYWSPGGAGDATNDQWPGGCTPCMEGTFSTKDRASSESDCDVCPKGTGYGSSTGVWDTVNYVYGLEGMTSCRICGDGFVSGGRAGGGPCQSISSGTVNVFSGGTQGRLCTQSSCGGCAAGTYALACRAYGSSATCTSAETEGLCAWDSSAGTCAFSNPANEPVFCVDCPGGYVQPNGGNSGDISSCIACAQGSYSVNKGHTSRYYGSRDPRACHESLVVSVCTGDGAGQCPDGSYGTTTAMTSSDSCAQCPAGTWVTRGPLTYRRSADAVCNNIGDGYPYPTGSCLVATGDCSKVAQDIGMDRCYLCPPGTFSTKVGATEVSTCLPCPKGYYCHAGTGTLVMADYVAYNIHMGLLAQLTGGPAVAVRTALLAAYPDATLGRIPTRAYSLGRGTEPVYCSLTEGPSQLHDAEGWVNDGHFSQFLWKEAYPNLFGPTGRVGYTDYWGVAEGLMRGARFVSHEDHTDPRSMYEDVCVASGGVYATGYYSVSEGLFYCCPARCTAGGSPGCGTAACADASFKSDCCWEEIRTSLRTCGPAVDAPCFLAGPDLDQSGALELNTTSDRVIQHVTINLVETLPFYFRAWGKNSVQQTLETANLTFGIRLHFYGNETQVEADVPQFSVETVFPVVSIPGSGLWRMIEGVINPPMDGVYSIAIEPFIDGAYEGVVYVDDIGVRVDPEFACNCSMGYFYNKSRDHSPEYTHPCQRCPVGYACMASGIFQCAAQDYAQGESFRCYTCPQGWLCDGDGKGNPTPCPAYTFEHEDEVIDKCLTCPLGSSCRNGKVESCDEGKYGTGSTECELCRPGYHPSNSSYECRRCPAGYESGYMDTECLPCSPDKYSTSGGECVLCPDYYFSVGDGNMACLSCLESPVLPERQLGAYRNLHSATLDLLPIKCIVGREWRIESSSHTGTPLGTVSWNPRPPTGMITASYRPYTDQLGVDTLVFSVTSGLYAPEQQVSVTVDITNPAPVASADSVTIRHPAVSTTLALSSLLENDADPNFDDLYLADFQWLSTDGRHGATSPSIDSARKILHVTVPGGFKGPMHQLQYRAMDAMRTSVALCVSPHCELSDWVTINITAKTSTPVAVDDSFVLMPSKTYLLDVTANDTDLDGDVIKILSVSAGTAVGSVQSVATVVEICTVCPSTCDSIVNSDQFEGLTSCSCDEDPATLQCKPSAQILGVTTALSPFFLSYATVSLSCGTDSFTYTVLANEDVPATASVSISTVDCICTGASLAGGLQLVFLFDGTGPDEDDGWGMMKAAATGIFRRVDVTSGSASVALLQFSGYGSQSIVKVHQAMSGVSVASALQLMGKQQRPAMQEETIECPEPPCTVLEEGLAAARAQLTGGRMVVILFLNHPYGDGTTIDSQIAAFTAAGIRTYVIAVQPVDERQIAYLAKDTSFVRLYSTYPSLYNDSSLPTDIIADFCV